MTEKVSDGGTPTKRCPKCGEEKLAVDFSPSSTGGKRYIRSWCKTCAAKSQRKYASDNRGKERIRCKEWAAKNPEKARAVAARSNKLAIQRMTDSYLAAMMGLYVADCPPEIIELKRQQIQVIRALKQLKEKANGK